MSSTNFQDAASATSTATGDYSVTFQTVRLGYIWTGSVQIPSAVSSSVLPVKFTAFDSGIPIGSWYNDQSSPNIQVQQQLSITASGLVVSTKLQAFFKGMITPAAETPPFWPGPTPAPPAGTPQLLPITGVNIAPADTVVTVGSASVIVGTSVDITCSFADNPAQLEVMWGTVAGSNLLGYFTFDLAASALLKGLVLPNLGPVITIKAITHAASTGMSLTLFTGLPPITRPPLVQGGDLTRYNAAIADGADSGEIILPPYVGDAQLFLTALVAGASPAAGAIFAILRSKDYTAIPIAELARVGATTQFIAGAGSTSLQPGYIWKMSPRINSIQVYNRIGGGVGVTVDMAISVSGP